MRGPCLILLVALASVAAGACSGSAAGDGGTTLDMAGNHCLDRSRNADETDVDCGGSCGATCVFGQRCGGERDCAVGSCINGACTPTGSTCSDHVRDGAETDVDCGGGCPLCAAGKRCAMAGDCLGGQCQAGVCRQAPPPFSFADARFAGAGRGTSGLVAGDFNGDGKLDLATSNRASNDVALLLGRGDGTFADARFFAVGQDPIDVCAADWNGDGRLDLATANLASGTVSLLLGSGDGSFAPASTPMVAVGAPVTVLALDANSDGHRDLMVVDEQGRLWLLLGDGAGGFTAEPPIHVGGSAQALAVADWNGDLLPDLAYVADYAVFAALNTGGGGFAMGQPVPAVSGSWYVAAGDVDGDGKADLVATSYQGFACVMRGDGSGGFAPPACTNVGGAPQGGPIADFDSDGRPDLALLDFGTDNIDLLRGRSDGTLDSAMTVYVGGTPQNLVVGDFNGDGRPDLAICDYSSHDVGVLLNTHP